MINGNRYSSLANSNYSPQQQQFVQSTIGGGIGSHNDWIKRTYDQSFQNINDMKRLADEEDATKQTFMDVFNTFSSIGGALGGIQSAATAGINGAAAAGEGGTPETGGMATGEGGTAATGGAGNGDGLQGGAGSGLGGTPETGGAAMDGSGASEMGGQASGGQGKSNFNVGSAAELLTTGVNLAVNLQGEKNDVQNDYQKRLGGLSNWYNVALQNNNRVAMKEAGRTNAGFNYGNYYSGLSR